MDLWIIVLGSMTWLTTIFCSNAINEKDVDTPRVSDPEVLRRELFSCQMEHLILIVDRGQKRFLSETVIKVIKGLHIPFVVYNVNIKNDLRGLVYHAYVTNRHRNFGVVSSSSMPFLEEVNGLFLNHSRGEMAAFPHRSRWLVFQDAEFTLEQHPRQNISLDNVVEIAFQENTISTVKTLLWRSSRRREWESVDLRQLGARCSIFPNKGLGLNGRQLVFLVMNSSYMMTIANNSAGNVDASGLLVDMNAELQRVLNFTSTLVPIPQVPKKDFWTKDVVGRLLDGSVDMGLIDFAQDSAYRSGLRPTYPMIFDQVVAAYVFEFTWPESNLGIYDCSSYILAVMLTSAVVSVAMIYKFLSYVTRYIVKDQERFSEQRDQNVEKTEKKNCEPLAMNFENTIEKLDIFSPSVVSGRVTPETPEDRHGLLSRLVLSMYRIYKYNPNFHLLGVYGSLLNQDTLERPKLFSLRVFVFSWCMFVILFNSAVIGTLTAGFIHPKNRPPFTSMVQVLTSEKVQCGTFYESELHEKSKFWIIEGNHLTRQLEHFPIYLNSSAEAFRTFMEQPASKLRVFLHYKKSFEYYKTSADFKNLYIIDDSFLHVPRSIATSKASDLNEIISSGLVKLHESGVMRKLIYKKIPPESYSKKDVVKFISHKKNLAYFGQIFTFIAIGLGLSFLCLGLELLIDHLVSYYNLRTV